MILVTGAAGVVGSALMDVLDDNAVGLTHRKSTSTPSVRGDITRPWLGLDPRQYRDLIARVDVVVHCAASVDFGASSSTLHKVNVVGTGHVLRFVADAGARMVHVSTAFLDSGEDSALHTYAQSKTRGEAMVRSSGLSATIARLSTVIGDANTGHLARLQAFPFVLGAGMQGKMPFLPCEPGTRMDLVPADTAAAALAALATGEAEHGPYWITAGSAALSLQQIVDVLFDIAQQRHRADTEATQLHMPAFKPRLIRPETYRRMMAMLGSAPGMPRAIAEIDRLLASFGADELPSSLATIPGGPGPMTTSGMERALITHAHYLADLPEQTWSML